MAVFDWAESPGTQLTEEPRVAATRYGDGYEERGPDGLNPLRQQWTLNFRDVEKKVADDIVAFFRARINAFGFEAFDWTPMWATAAIRVVCRQWTRTQNDAFHTSDITATFTQEFGQ